MNSLKLTWLLFINIIYSDISSQNLALNKSYTLSTAPNYVNSAPASDRTSLTDGIYTKGYFWSQSTTVGWEHVPVTITIDIGEVRPISAVTFNTVRFDQQLVNFPKNIFVFISSDDKNYKYVGDLADTSDNIPGSYLIKKFSLNNINASSRYVTLSVIPNGVFLFCDEIEILKGNATTSEQVGLIPKDRLKQAVDSLKNVEFFRENLIQSIERLQNISKAKAGIEDPKYVDIKNRLAKKNASENDLINLKNEVGAEHALKVRTVSKSSYTVEMYNPWDSLSEFYEPKENPAGIKYNFSVPVKGVQYGSFIVTNSSNSSQTFTFKVSNENTSLIKFQLFNVPYVPSLNYAKTPDPLVPLKGSVVIQPGNTEMFMFSIIGVNRGNAKVSITLSSMRLEKTMNIIAQVFNFPETKAVENLNANVWAYFTRPIIKERQKEAFQDLAEHHVNTIVIPPAILPTMQTGDYNVLLNYISIFKGVKNVLLFMNYGSVQLRNGYSNGQFLSDEWKSKFIDWYHKITGYIRQNGFPDSRIFLYPYDEVDGKNIDDLKAFAGWAKQAIPGIRFFATLANDAAVHTLFPFWMWHRSNPHIKA